MKWVSRVKDGGTTAEEKAVGPEVAPPEAPDARMTRDGADDAGCEDDEGWRR